MRTSFVVLCALAAASATANAGIWVEGGSDATQFPPGQITVGAGPLIGITGKLDGFLDVDAYCIHIHDPVAFGAWTQSAYGGGAFAGFDSQLWLFGGPSGGPAHAIMHSDDTTDVSSGMGPGQPNPIFGPAPAPFGPGRYMLAISQYDVDALDPAGAEIWSDSPFAGYSGPDGPGVPIFGGWDGGGAPSPVGGGDYFIALAGATFCDIPAPSAAALLGLGGLITARRRR